MTPAERARRYRENPGDELHHTPEQETEAAFLAGWRAAVEASADVAACQTNETDSAYRESGLLPVGESIAARIRALLD